MIAFVCEHCQTRLRVGDHAAGRRIQCTKCRKTVTVPTIEPEPELATVPRDELESQHPVNDERLPVNESEAKAPVLLAPTDKAFLEAPGVIRFLGDYQTALLTMQQTIIGLGGSIETDNAAVVGMLSASWHYGLNPRGLWVTAVFSAMNDGSIQIAVQSRTAAGAASSIHAAAQQANAVITTFLSRFSTSFATPMAFGCAGTHFLQQDVPGALPHRGKSKVAAGVLAILLGVFGIHDFYLGSWGWGLVCLLLCWTYIPALWGLVDGIVLLTMAEEKFDRKYNSRSPAAFELTFAD